MPTSYPSITALDGLIADLGVGEARRRQLGMVRGELNRALAKDALPVGARRSLRRLLEKEALEPYVRLAESGVLRARRIGGGYPPTSGPTNTIRLQVVDLLREALALPVLQLAGGAPVLRPTPAADQLAALRRQLDQYLSGGAMSPGQTRLTAVLGLCLDAAPRSGELIELRLSNLADGNAAVYIERTPQGGNGGDPAGEWVETSPLTRAALDRWLAVRQELVERAHGTSKLWVSLRMNHDGLLDDGEAVMRPPGMPLEENGLITSYRTGRLRYPGLRTLLPEKLEQLRRAAEEQRATA